ncbi:hypothetical protein BN903_73 [Halorubrum sp. AJ67]|nr:hypothetical protein BN903_73 [Halorubrum sp. AJ67]
MEILFCGGKVSWNSRSVKRAYKAVISCLMLVMGMGLLLAR